MEENKKKIKFIITTFMLIFMCIIIYIEVKNVDIQEIRKISDSLSIVDKSGFLILSLLSFSCVTFYDFVLCKDNNLNLSKKEIFKIAWISQSFNNFISLGGATGGTLREHLYESSGVNRQIAINMAFMRFSSGLIGLFLLSPIAIVGLIKTNKFEYIPIFIFLFFLAIAYIFIDKIKVLNIEKFQKVTGREKRRIRFKLSMASLIDWTFAAIFYAYIIRYFQSDITILESFIVYIISTIIGIISMSPSGIGTFEGTTILLFKALGYSVNNVALSVFIFRICYTIIPWLIGIMILLVKYRKKAVVSERQINLIANILAVSVFFTGLILVFSVATPEILKRITFLNILLSRKMIVISGNITLLLGLLLILFSKGISGRVRVVHRYTIIILSLAAMFSVFKGLDYEEAILCLIISAGLFVFRKYFNNDTNRINKKKLTNYIYGIIMIYLLYIFLYNFTHKVDFLNGNTRYSLDYIKINIFRIFDPILISMVIALAIMGTSKKYLSFKKNTEEDIVRFENFIENYESNAYTHLFYVNDKNYFINEDNTVLFLYKPYKEHILVLGDPIGKKKDFVDAIDEFIIWANEKKMIISFYEISDKYLEIFIEEGFRFLKIGENSVVDLKDFNLDGKRNKILRKTLNGMFEQGLEFKIVEPPFDSNFIEKLKKISDEWLNGRKEMKFSLGSFKEEYINRASVFIIEDGSGIKAFATMLPILNTKSFSIDLMRHIKDAPNGIMDMLFINIFNYGKEKGYEYFELGIAPLSNVGKKKYSGTKEKLIDIGYKYGNRIYGFEGLRKYKNKFNPEWSSVFIAYKNEYQILEILLALGMVCNTDNINDID